MTQLNYINKPVFDHGAIEQISEILGGMGIKKPLDMHRPWPGSIGNVRPIKESYIK